MKNRGLKNRFPQSVRSEWEFWYDCMWCGRNRWNVLHHIIFPSCDFYVAGEHNKSILNSSPLHNDKCHLYNSDLKKQIPELLNKTYSALVFKMGYCLKPIDKEFLKKYVYSAYQWQ